MIPVRPAINSLASPRCWLMVLLAGTLVLSSGTRQAHAEEKPKAPELDGGIAWINTDKPISIHKDLKGKIVILDFWTLCCINCIHTLPVLARLEEKYAKELVVIGVHTAKFENEKNTESIRKAVLRYRIKHPVVNDGNMKIWETYGVSSWPTLAVIDPEGNGIGFAPGEGNDEILDKVIQKLIDEHKKKMTLSQTPIHFTLEKNLVAPLNFPGKVLADEKSNRLFIADSTNNRIVITDLAGNKIAVAGSGTASKDDGPFEKAGFNDPQGMALKGELLYVADRKNHLIRTLDLKSKLVKTVAGIGVQDRDSRGLGGEALKVGLNSPWDLCLDGDRLFIAMAGHHQIWVLDLKEDRLDAYAGDGRENIQDGGLALAEFAQPSGLTTDGTRLYVADSEVSAVRSVGLGRKGDIRDVRTLVGTGLFDFGDKDGIRA